MNAQLKQAYVAFYLRMGNRLRNKGLANPLFISYDEADETPATKKVMVFGKQTVGWQDSFGTTLDQLLAAYDEFYNKKDEQNMRDCYRTPGFFWNEFRMMEQEFMRRSPDVKLIWNNILKVGGQLGAPQDALVDLYMPDAAELIRKEIEIINPAAVLFMTSPENDRHILSVFPDAQLLQVNYSIDAELLARVKSSHLPKKSVRTFHPQEINTVLERDYEMDKERFREMIVGNIC